MYPTTRPDSTWSDRVSRERVGLCLRVGLTDASWGWVGSVAAGTQNGFNTGVCQYETQVYVGHRRVHRDGRGRVQ